MVKSKIVAPTGTQEVHVDYGKVLLTQKGGWTLEELEMENTPRCQNPLFVESCHPKLSIL